MYLHSGPLNVSLFQCWRKTDWVRMNKKQYSSTRLHRKFEVFSATSTLFSLDSQTNPTSGRNKMLLRCYQVNTLWKHMLWTGTFNMELTESQLNNLTPGDHREWHLLCGRYRGRLFQGQELIQKMKLLWTTLLTRDQTCPPGHRCYCDKGRVCTWKTCWEQPCERFRYTF